MSNTDHSLKIATDLAYIDLDIITNNMDFNKKSPPTIQEILEAAKEQEQKETVQKIEKILNNPNNEELKSQVLSWKLVDVHNKNKAHGNGFYGCVIDTNEGLIASFRGSEPITNPQHAEQDWKDADIGLVNSTMTQQQAEAEVFLEKINNSKYIQGYDNITFAGHSLGGNLAFHATIMSTEYENIYRNLTQSANFDGPGFSNEYIEMHADRIAMVNDKMNHYQWSVVGTILESLPGVDRQTLKSELAEKGPLKWLIHEIGGKHSTDTLVFGPDGKALAGQKTDYEHIMGKFTEFIDRVPAPIGNLLTDVLGGIIIVATWDSPWVKVAMGAGALLLLVTVGPAALAAFAGKVILAIVAFAAIEMALDNLGDIWASAVNLAKDIGKALSWTGQQLANVIDFIGQEVGRVNNWLRNLFGLGTAAVATPLIEVNTYKLRQYAARLESVKARLRQLDSDMNSLYWKAGFLDLLSVIRANNLPSSAKMNKYIHYLEDTATAFESAERNIMSSV
ncbi:DUF2974 domain-containing protein [Neobacillus notoginsengisoli]|uniref:DUF2974 domain-containing protein n=1 Tax=Neobacillus notoginsengisoli TaxID=1578198 RepID=A0A417YYL9_9BACI|nr:Mbeg1-like protein [Neobacillus notoginsengisoli]RHW42735.1 DUF2974 domain-containing protein [Neobacillus notoginsengisoli]